MLLPQLLKLRALPISPPWFSKFFKDETAFGAALLLGGGLEASQEICSHKELLNL